MKAYLFFLILLFNSLIGNAQVQINAPFSFPDVNVVEHNGRAYAFGGTDLEPYNFDIKTFIMPYWRCFSSDDLINWKLESTMYPTDSYMGQSDKCFAGHGIYKNNTWFWYFSNFVKNTGVVTSQSPKGPWIDPLGKPLLDENISITHEYDGCVFTDDDAQSYIIYGSWKDKQICYHIAALNDDMISLKSKPVKIQVNNIPEGHSYIAVDAPFMHKHNGLYYLSWRRPYAVSKNINGPYEFVGLQDALGHLGFFSFRNQDFVNYTMLKEGFRKRYRFCAMAYVHYNNDGTIAKMEDLIKEHGVGQYSASWPAIEAEWFMDKPLGPQKIMTQRDHFVVGNIRHGDYLFYPNIRNIKTNASVSIKYSSKTKTGGTIIIKASSAQGPKLGKASFENTKSWDKFKTVLVPLGANPPGDISLFFEFEGKEKEELIRIDNFKIEYL